VRIGLLEDDLSQIELMNLWAKESGDHLKSYTNGKCFRKALESENFDLFILDWHLPDTTGIEELNWLRSHKALNTPVIFITSRDNEESVVEALEHGANDYIVKPVNKRITQARIKSLQKYHYSNINITNKELLGSDNHNIELYPPFTINKLEKNIYKNGDVINLTHKEFELATYLFQNMGCLITRDTLMDVIWGTQANLNTRTVDTHISRIRSKLGISPAIGWQLKSIYQQGYRLFQVSNQ